MTSVVGTDATARMGLGLGLGLGPVARECIAAFNPAELHGFDHDIEKELVLALHASIFYIRMRKWVYRTIMPKDTNLTIAALVTGFLEAMRSRIRSSVVPPGIHARSSIRCNTHPRGAPEEKGLRRTVAA
jgi:hypothetical protein